MTKIKGPKPPNWKLKPNAAVAVWSEDPLFESSAEEAPFVSSAAHGKLAIRAVLTADPGLLRRCVADKKRIHSVDVGRSMATRKSALHYAVKRNDPVAMRILAAANKDKKGPARVASPVMRMHTVGTGDYNPTALGGLRHVRHLQMSRGSREGNNALNKDDGSDGDNNDCLANDMMEANVDVATVALALELKCVDASSLARAVYVAVESGNAALAAHVVGRDADECGIASQFSRFHREALTMTEDDDEEMWTGLREASVRKRTWRGLSPMHCACANPDATALKRLFAVCPDVNLADRQQRKLVHYAAGAAGLSPLRFLVEHGANLEDVDRRGTTPLMLACKVGRLQNVEFIVETIKTKKRGVGDEIVKKLGVGGVNKPDRWSSNALHFACHAGRADVVEMLVGTYGADVERTLSVNCEKRTPLMLAAAGGHRAIVEYLAGRAKIEKADRHGRTALTHAVMNGAADVASLLLAAGADPDGADSSGNSHLHYACAYGWYFCVKVLVEAGAALNVANEWKLSPLAVAFLKGHAGLAKYLLDLPGVDIDYANDEGRTVLLVMVAEADEDKPLGEELFGEIVDMVERRGADATLADHGGMNALHFLCAYPVFEAAAAEAERTKVAFAKGLERQRKIFSKFVEFFVSKRCSVLAADKNGCLPLMFCLAQPTGKTKTKDYVLVETILTAMKGELRWNKEATSNVPAGKPSVLTLWAENASLFHVARESKLLEGIAAVVDSLDGKSGMVEARDRQRKNLTPFLSLCQSYADTVAYEKPSDDDTDYQAACCLGLKFKADGTVLGIESNWSQFCQLIANFMQRFSPATEYVVRIAFKRDGKRVTGNATLSALAILADAPNEPKELRGSAMRSVLDRGGAVDCFDHLFMTSLLKAIQADKVIAALLHIEAGANVNWEYTIKITKGENKGKHVTSNPIIDATEKGQLKVVESLLAHGAAVSGLDQVQLCGVAVASCLKDRSSQARHAILRRLIGNGMVIATDPASRRTPLHVAVNGSSDAADESLDLETILIAAGCDLAARDKRGRLPLHYAFVKVGRLADSSKMDPIEVVSTLLDASEDAEAAVRAADEFGSTALHYAAYRGATVCCLLLLQKGADIGGRDGKGNTPLAYAVLGGHDGAALVLLQNGASVNVDVHPMAEPEEDRAFKYLPEHYKDDTPGRTRSLFRGIVENGWLGVCYLAMKQLEACGMSFAAAVEVALQMQKLQFAKNLIAKQADKSQLLTTTATAGRNLLACLAHACRRESAPELQADIFDRLAGVISACDSDDAQGTPLHYACMHFNETLIRRLLKTDGVAAHVNAKNTLGHTPLSLLFRNFVASDAGFGRCVTLLLENGADVKVLVQAKRLSYAESGFFAKGNGGDGDREDGGNHAHRLTPLIVAVAHREAAVIERLMTHDAALVNFADEAGMAPLDHAVKTNDINVVLQLFNAGGAKPTEADFRRPKAELNRSGVDVDVCDGDGRRQAIRYLIDVDDDVPGGATYDNVDILELLLRADCRPVLASSEYAMAMSVGAVRIAQKLRRHGSGCTTDDRADRKRLFERPDDCVDWDGDFAYDVAEDARAMLTQLEAEADREALRKKKGRDDHDDDDDDDGDAMDVEEGDDGESNDDGDSNDDMEEGDERDELLEKNYQCIVQDGKIHQGYTILMSKIDVTFGKFGMYNFYRMQASCVKHNAIRHDDKLRMNRSGRRSTRSSGFSSPTGAAWASASASTRTRRSVAPLRPRPSSARSSGPKRPTSGVKTSRTGRRSTGP